jgi:hypothetical protein
MKHLSVLNTLIPPISLRPEDTVENAIAIESLQNEIQSLDNEVDRGLDMALALEELSTIIDKIQILKPSHQAMIYVAGNLATAGTNIDADNVIPSMESDDGGSKESMVAKLKANAIAIVKMIKEFVAQVWESFKKLLNQLTIQASLTNQKAKDYEDRIRKVRTKSIDAFITRPVIFEGKPVTDIQEMVQLAIKAGSLDKEYSKFIETIEHTFIKTSNALANYVKGATSGQNPCEELVSGLDFKKNLAFFGGYEIKLPDVDVETELFSSTARVVIGDQLKRVCRAIRLQVIAPEAVDALDHQVMSPSELLELIKAFKEINASLSPTNASGLPITIKRAERTIKMVQDVLENALKETPSQLNSSNSIKDEEKFDVGLYAIRSAVPTFIAMTSHLLSTFNSTLLRNNALLSGRLSGVIEGNLKAYGV